MDKRVLRERMRRKKRQMMIRKYTRLGMYAVAAILVVVFVVRGVILPIAHRVTGSDTKSAAPGETVEVQAEPVEADPNAAVRRPLKGAEDATKISSLTPGWHESEDGQWYQNPDGTYYAGGFQKIDGVTYSFDENGYIQTGWVSKGVKDYYFNEDGSYNPDEKRPMIALTYDDGPGQYTDKLLDCLKENGAKATFFMLGENVEKFPDTVKRMAEEGHEIGTHSYSHPNLLELDLDSVAKQFTDTDEALKAACGQIATVARAPYGNWSEDIINTVGKPFFMWSLDSLDWDLKDANLDYDSVMNSDYLKDGTVILMHDIHEASVEASLKIIPELVAQGYKLVTVSEMAEAKGVELQLDSYSEFWQSSLDQGLVAGYNGGEDELLADSSGDSQGESADFNDGGTSGENASDGETSGEGSGDEASSAEDFGDGSGEDSAEEGFSDGE